MDEKLNILAQKVLNSALKVTPIICLPNPPSAIPLGCGMFLKINDDIYLISAGHLLNLKDWLKLLVTGANDSLVLLNGTVMTTYENSKTSNPIDFGLLKFSERQIKHLTGGNFSFLAPSNIIVNHKVKQGGNYLVAGYPVSGIKKKSGKSEFHPEPIKLFTYPLESKKYSDYGVNPDHFILVRYERKAAPFGSKIKQITKELKGISGSGLWYVPDWDDLTIKGTPKFYLVGIMVENHKDKGFISALRIDFVTQTIKEQFIDSAFEDTHFTFEGTPYPVYASKVD